MVAEAHLKTVDIIYRYEARDTAARPLPMDSDAALRRLNGGNSDFAALLDHVKDESGIQQIIPVDPGDLGLDPNVAGAPKQRPFAAVLGCSDARVPIELIFNEGPNDLFVVRVAGNGLGTEVLGSLKYAVDHLGGTLKLIVVLGHSGCGALTAAVDVFLNPGDYLAIAAQHSIRNILDRVAHRRSGVGKQTAFGIRPRRHAQSGIPAGADRGIDCHQCCAFGLLDPAGVRQPRPAELQAVYGVYVLETREVWAPRSAGIKASGLASPPRDLAGFAALADAVVQSERIASYLKPGASD